MLNFRYRGIDETTDVLSFPQQEWCKLKNKKDSQLNLSLITCHSPFILGDIIINLHQAKRQADSHGLTLHKELRRLLIHGLLHLIGYDHEKSTYQKKKMESKEKKLLNALMAG